MNGKPLPELLSHVVRNLNKSFPERSGCGILLADPVEAHLVHGSSAALPKEMLEALLPLPICEGSCTCGTAAATGTVQVHENISNHPHWTGKAELVLSHGFTSCTSAPIHGSDQTVLGTVAVYLPGEGRPSPTAMRSLLETARSASLAIQWRRLREEARQREELFRQMAENIEEIFYAIDTITGKLIYASPAYEAITGRSLRDLYTRPASYLSHIHPGDRTVATEAVRRQTQGKESNVEYRLIRPDGEVRWLSDRTFPVTDAQGQRQRLVGIVRDITESKLSRLALNRSNRALRLLSACNEALVRTHQEEGLLHRICQLAIELGGYDQAWVAFAKGDQPPSVVARVQNPAFQGPSPHALLALHGPIRRTLQTGQKVLQWMGENHAEHHPGKNAINLVALPLSVDSSILGVLCLQTSEATIPSADEVSLLQSLADNLAFGILHLRQEENQRQAEVQLGEQTSLLANARDAILVFDLSQTLVYWNKRAASLYNLEGKEPPLASVPDLLGLNSKEFQEALQQVRESSEWEGEVAHLNPAGRKVIMEARWTLVPGEKGRPSRIMAIHTDITARKEIEEQFLQIQRLEGIGSVAGGMAHDLNNMLAPMTLAADMLRSKTDTDETRELVDLLSGNLRRASDMVRQILAYARGATGKQAEVQLDLLVQSVLRMIRDTFPKEIEIRTDLAEDLAPVLGDPTQLQQVLLNLCLNARDAMPEGGTLTVRGYNLETQQRGQAVDLSAQPQVVLEVEDTGTGIPPEIRERIFEAFFTTKQSGQGTGLGLSTSLSIVRRHQGKLDVLDGVGRGTLFRLTLPNPLKRKAKTQPVPLPRQELLGRGETILVVDEEEAIRRMTGALLRQSGYEVLLAGSGGEACSLYRNQMSTIRMVLLDLNLRHLSGVKTAASLRQLNPEARIVVTSGAGAQARSIALEKIKAQEFLAKPFPSSKLLRLVRSILDK